MWWVRVLYCCLLLGLGFSYLQEHRQPEQPVVFESSQIPQPKPDAIYTDSLIITDPKTKFSTWVQWRSERTGKVAIDFGKVTLRASSQTIVRALFVDKILVDLRFCKIAEKQEKDAWPCSPNQLTSKKFDFAIEKVAYELTETWLAFLNTKRSQQGRPDSKNNLGITHTV